MLKPGDAILYRPASAFGYLIAIKTWTWISHVEVYLGDYTCAAARESGVNLYGLDCAHAAYVLRPKGSVNIRAARKWFQTVRGQKYDFLGLLVFYLAARHGAKDRMFCSELATRFYRHGGFQPVAKVIDADRVAPAQYLQSLAFDLVWSYRRMGKISR